MLFNWSVMGSERSAYPETLTRIFAEYVPGARVSQTLVEVNRRLFGVVPLVESTVSQIGRLAVFTEKKGAGFESELRVTSTFPAFPEPRT